jgi:hypothetical protein
MRRRSLLATFALFLGLCCHAQTSPNTDAKTGPVFSITTDPPPGAIHTGSPIIVTITLTNISGNEISLSMDRGKNSGYKIFKILLTKDKAEVETTFFDRKVTGRNRPDDPVDFNDLSGSSILLPYPPGKKLVVPMDLAELYEIKKPGVYTFEVSRFDEYSKTTVRSKPLTLNVVP